MRALRMLAGTSAVLIVAAVLPPAKPGSLLAINLHSVPEQ